MTNYYVDQRKAFIQLSKMLETAKTNEIVLSKTKMLLDLTLAYPVSYKAIENRLKYIQEIDKNLIIDGDEIYYPAKEEEPGEEETTKEEEPGDEDK